MFFPQEFFFLWLRSMTRMQEVMIANMNDALSVAPKLVAEMAEQSRRMSDALSPPRYHVDGNLITIDHYPAVFAHPLQGATAKVLLLRRRTDVR